MRYERVFNVFAGLLAATGFICIGLVNTVVGGVLVASAGAVLLGLYALEKRRTRRNGRPHTSSDQPSVLDYFDHV